MEYIQTHSTRKPVYLIIGIIFIAIGGLLSPMLLYGVIGEKEFSMLVPLIISLILLVFGVVSLYWYVVPKVGKGILTEHAIRCELSGKLKLEILKEDIDHVHISRGMHTSILSIMKKGKGFQKTINWFYFQDLDAFYEQLPAFGYKVTMTP